MQLYVYHKASTLLSYLYHTSSSQVNPSPHPPIYNPEQEEPNIRAQQEKKKLSSNSNPNPKIAQLNAQQPIVYSKAYIHIILA